ncbi:MAG: hypothetical protein VKP70_09440 [Cyanobacteriota bacterium]|nr:hypothetical protein [Cyanobacteriota bacterium]
MATPRLPHPVSLRQASNPMAGPRPGRERWWLVASLLAMGLASGGCQRGPSEEMRRLDRVDLKLQQLEQRLNKIPIATPNGADKPGKGGKPAAGVIKSLTLRLGSEDDRLRIYWGDGSQTDLPCTKEQSTYVCG